MPQRSYRFVATISAPGFHDTAPVWASTHARALRKARHGDLATMPYKGWPSPERREITVNPEWEAVTDVDGVTYLRRAWEAKERAALAVDRHPALGIGARLLNQLVG